MFLEPIESPHIIEVVNKLNPEMSFGHDGFSAKILKESIHAILLPITHIIKHITWDRNSSQTNEMCKSNPHL